MYNWQTFSTSVTELFSKNIEQRIKTLEENPSTAYTTDLIKIALLSTSHLKTVTDFLLTVSS